MEKNIRKKECWLAAVMSAVLVVLFGYWFILNPHGYWQKEKEEYVLNYFNNRSTNASAESLNSKMKGFRAQVRGVADLTFFMYRMMMIFG